MVVEIENGDDTIVFFDGIWAEAVGETFNLNPFSSELGVDNNTFKTQSISFFKRLMDPDQMDAYVRSKHLTIEDQKRLKGIVGRLPRIEELLNKRMKR